MSKVNCYKVNKHVMKYTIYKTTNKLNGMFYIGKHQTENPNDEYYGSGLHLMRAIAKYGKENFQKEVLFIFDNEQRMNEKERELVNEDLVNDPQCYNMMIGGEGGDTWSHVGRKHSEETKRKISNSIRQHILKSGDVGHQKRSQSSKEFNARLKADPEKYAQIQKKRIETAKRNWKLRKENGYNNKEYHLQKELTRKKISNSLKAYYDKIGRKQSKNKPMPYKSENAFGKMIKVHLNNEEHTIYECDLQWYLNNGWIMGRNPNNKKPLALSEEAKNRSSGKGKKIVHNILTGEIKRINPNELQNYLDNGWKSGYLNKKKKDF